MVGSRQYTIRDFQLLSQRCELRCNGLGLFFEVSLFCFRRTADAVSDLLPLFFQLVDLGINIFSECRKLLCGVDVTVAEELMILDILIQLSYLLPEQR